MSTEQKTASMVIAKMMEKDAFSRWLGIEVLSVNPGNVVINMTVRPEMLNGFGVCHGGVTFSLADSALAFACNSHGRLSLMLSASISLPAKIAAGDLLTATAVEERLTNKTGIYRITITNQDAQTVGLFQGTVYRTGKSYPDDTNEDQAG